MGLSYQKIVLKKVVADVYSLDEADLYSLNEHLHELTLHLWLSTQKLVTKTMLHSLAVSTVCSMATDRPIIMLGVKILADW